MSEPRRERSIWADRRSSRRSSRRKHGGGAWKGLRLRNWRKATTSAGQRFYGLELMGEAKRRQSATAKLIAEFPHCYFCGGRRPSTTREHMPPKALFDNAHRPDKLIMPACTVCNRETSTADLAASIISRWNYNTYGQLLADHRKLIGQIRIQAPELLAEWKSAQQYGIESARGHLQRGLFGAWAPAPATSDYAALCHAHAGAVECEGDIRIPIRDKSRGRIAGLYREN